MPPHKSKSRGHQQAQPPPQPSDYETDAPLASVPVPRPRSIDEMNLSVIQRHYPEVVAILHTTSYAVLYTLNLNLEQWEKAGIEGTLFICELTPSPAGALRYAAVMLNRRGLENFFLELTSDEQMEITEEYTIVQSDRVYGIWIFAEPPPSSTAYARIETSEKMQALARQAAASKRAAEQAAENGMKEADQAEGGVPMGRQLSLRELFGQQREQDAGFSVRNHHTQPPPPSQLRTEHHVQGQEEPQSGPAQHDVLGQLFSKAKQDYNGIG